MTRPDPKRDRTVGAAESWTLKGVDPGVRARAQDVARRSGLTLAELMSRLIAEAGATSQPASETKPKTPPPSKALARPVKRTPAPVAPVVVPVAVPVAAKPKGLRQPRAREAVEPQSPASTIAELTARLEVVERRSPLDEARERQNGADHRLERLETQETARLEASQALEEVIVAVAAQICEGEGRAELHALQTREGIRALRRRVDRIEALPAQAAALSVDAELARLERRLEEDRQQTAASLRALEGALAGLEQLVRGVGVAPAGFAAMDVPLASEASAPEETAFAEPILIDDEEADGFDTAVKDLSERAAAADLSPARAIESTAADLLANPGAHFQGPERRGKLAPPVEADFDELGDQLRRVIDAFETQDEPLAADPAAPALASEAWSVESFAQAGEPAAVVQPPTVEAELPPPETSPAPQMQMMDMLCEALPSASDPIAASGAERDRIEVGADTPPPAAPPPAAAPAPVAEPIDTAVDVPPTVDSIRSKPPSAAPAPQAGSTPGSSAAPPASAVDAEERVREVDTFLAAQLMPLTAPRPFAPDVIPEPPTRTGANWELIESARTAARKSAEGRRRSPLDALTAKSGEASPHDAGDVLDLRNGFGLLRRRNQRAG